MSNGVPEMTCQELADYFAWQCQTGKAKFKVRICPRGLSNFRPEFDKEVGLAIPHDGHTSDEKNKLVFVRASF